MDHLRQRGPHHSNVTHGTTTTRGLTRKRHNVSVCNLHMCVMLKLPFSAPSCVAPSQPLIPSISNKFLSHQLGTYPLSHTLVISLPFFSSLLLSPQPCTFLPVPHHIPPPLSRSPRPTQAKHLQPAAYLMYMRQCLPQYIAGHAPNKPGLGQMQLWLDQNPHEASLAVTT